MQTAQLLEQLYNGKTLNKEESAVIFTILFQTKNASKTDRSFCIKIIKNPSLNSGFLF